MDKGCIDEARKELPDFTDEELKGYAQQVYEEVRSRGLTGRAQALEEAQAAVNQRVMDAYVERAQVTLNNITKVEAQGKLLSSKKANMRELMGRYNRNLGQNIAAAQKASSNELADFMYNNLTPEEIAFFAKRKNHQDIINALDGNRSSPEAEKIARKLKEYVPFRNQKMIESNALLASQIQDHRFLNPVHDKSKMLAAGRNLIQAAKSGFKYDADAGKNLWKSTIKQHIDMKGTFRNTDAMREDGTLDMAKVNEILDHNWENITSHDSELFTKSEVANDREALERKQHMFFQWKSYADWAKYDEKYGSGDIFSATNADIHTSGNKIGMARMWGDNPASAYLALEKIQQEVDPKSPRWWKGTSNLYKQVSGSSKTVVDPTIAAIGGNSRSITSMAHLAELLPMSTTDLNQAASYAERWGVNYWKAYSKQLESYFSQYTNSQQKQIARMLHLDVQAHMNYVGKFVDSENLSALTKKVSAKYYTLNLTHMHDNAQRIGIMSNIGGRLGKLSTRDFARLPKNVQYQLGKFNITQAEWNALRTQTAGKMFTMDNVNKMSDSTIRALKQVSDTPNLSFADYKASLYRKVHSLFQVATENAITTASEVENSFLLGATKAGTYGGEIRRSFMQFKGFALAYANRTLVNGFKDADSIQAKIGWAISSFAYMMPFSYLSMWLTYRAQGLSMPDFEQMNGNEKTEFLAQLTVPGLSIILGLLSPYEQHKGLLWALMGTPSVSLLTNAFSTLFDMGAQPDKLKKDFIDDLNNILPISRMPVVAPYFNSMTGSVPYLQPGQQQLYGT